MNFRDWLQVESASSLPVAGRTLEEGAAWVHFVQGDETPSLKRGVLT